MHHLASQFMVHSCELWYTVVGTRSRRVINYLSMLDRDPHMQVALQKILLNSYTVIARVVVLCNCSVSVFTVNLLKLVRLINPATAAADAAHFSNSRRRCCVCYI